jgi:hypothetical protein
MSRAVTYSQAAKQVTRSIQQSDVGHSDLRVWNFYPAPRKWSTHIRVRTVNDAGIAYDLTTADGRNRRSADAPDHFATGGIVQNADTGECFTIGGQA